MKRKLKDEVIGKRRFELFMRDPLRKEAEIAFRNIFAPNLSGDEKTKRRDHCTNLLNEIKKKWNCSLNGIWEKEDIEDIATGRKKIFDYCTERKGASFKYILNEWADPNEVKLDPDTMAKSDACLIFSSRASTVKEYEYEKEILKFELRKHNDLMCAPHTYKKFEDSGYILYPGHGAYDDKGRVYIPVPSEHIVFGIDIGGLSEKDKSRVTEEIWTLIKSKIKERKAKGQRGLPAVNDPKELGFITTLSDDVFANYLKWYDLHMGADYNTPSGLPFRTIAFHEYLERKHPDRAQEAKRKIATERKGVVGQPIKGEDHVEKGVKLIYQAIHRKEYPSKKRLGLFHCPEHGSDCPRDCSYLEKYMEDFNKRKMLWKSLKSLSPEVLEQVVDDYYNPKKTKHKKLD